MTYALLNYKHSLARSNVPNILWVAPNHVDDLAWREERGVGGESHPGVHGVDESSVVAEWFCYLDSGFFVPLPRLLATTDHGADDLPLGDAALLDQTENVLT